MGVSDLWPIFDEKSISLNKNLAELRGKKVAVDMSCWTMQSKTTVGLNLSKKPHLKILFYRTKALLMEGVIPIFVMDGKPPDCKGITIRKRLKRSNPHAGGEVLRTSFDILQRECQDLLRLLGIPCVKSAGEAESLCAFLNSNGIVDGCITEDNDAFLYGAKTIYRGFTAQHAKEAPQLKAYEISDIEQKLHLDRRKLIALALLVGCDYMDGVPGVGKETALKLLAELDRNDCDVLERIGDWRTKNHAELFPSLNPDLEVKRPPHCSLCAHPGKQRDHSQSGCSFCNTQVSCSMPRGGELCTCTWHQNANKKERAKHELKVSSAVQKMDSFSYEETVSEYLHERNIVPSEKELEWSAPNISGFQEKAEDWFGWPLDASFKAIFPLYIVWQLAQRCQTLGNEPGFLFRPLRIAKIQKESGINKYKVIWKSLCEDDDVVNEESLSTLNDVGEFTKAYPSIVSDYQLEIIKKEAAKQKEKEEKAKIRKEKAKKKASNKRRGKMSDISGPKISDYFATVPKISRKSSPDVDDISIIDDEPPMKRLSVPRNFNSDLDILP